MELSCTSEAELADELEVRGLRLGDFGNLGFGLFGGLGGLGGGLGV